MIYKSNVSPRFLPFRCITKYKERAQLYLATMLFVTTVIFAILSPAPSIIGSSVPTGDMERMTGRYEPLARPAEIASAPPSDYNGEIPANYLRDYKNTQRRKKDTINLTYIVDSTIGTPAPSPNTSFFLAALLPALAFFAAVSGEARIRIARVIRGYCLEKRTRIDLEHKLAQAENEKAQLASSFLDIDQALKVKEEQRKEAAYEADDLREKLAQLGQKELLLRKDLALSKENIKGLQATVAKKGKEALEYRAQAYRLTQETPPTQMSRLRFGGSQILPILAVPRTRTHTSARDQRGHARSTESEVDDGGRKVVTGGTRETVIGNRPADKDIPRYMPFHRRRLQVGESGERVYAEFP